MTNDIFIFLDMLKQAIVCCPLQRVAPIRERKCGGSSNIIPPI